MTKGVQNTRKCVFHNVTNIHTDRHCDSMNDLAQRAKPVKKASKVFICICLMTQYQIEGGGLVQGVTKSIAILLTCCDLKQKPCQLNFKKMEMIHNI